MSKDSFSKYLELKIMTPKWFVISILVIVGVFFVSQIVPVVLIVLGLVAAGKDEAYVDSLFSDNSAFQFFIYTAIATLSVYLIYRYLKWQKDKPIKFLMLETKTLRWANLWDVIITYGLYFMTVVAATVFLDVFTSVDVNQSQELGISRPDTGISRLLVFASLVVLPPISEEIIFRGFLFNKLKKYSSYLVATLSTSVLFGVAHLEFSNLNWIAAIDTLIFSFYLIYISQKHQSLYSSILLHAIKNGIAFYVLFIR